MELELCLSVSPYAGGSYGIGASDGMVKTFEDGRH